VFQRTIQRGLDSSRLRRFGRSGGSAASIYAFLARRAARPAVRRPPTADERGGHQPEGRRGAEHRAERADHERSTTWLLFITIVRNPRASPTRPSGDRRASSDMTLGLRRPESEAS